jgi:phosphatidate cytidylyltransferase
VSKSAVSGQQSAVSEYRKRLIMGALMALLAAGVLLADGYLAGWLGGRFYPCLFVAVLLLIVLSCLELHALLGALARPPLYLTLAGTVLLSLASWPGWLAGLGHDPWRDVAWTFAALVLVYFLYEIAVFREPGNVVVRAALFVWILAYLGLLPAFLVQLRFWPDEPDGASAQARGAAALALVIFVPKCCDIGAYFTGRYLGRHRMTPLLSPKKTWEGFAGGMAAAVATALVLGWLVVPLFRRGPIEAVLFGLVVGVAGVLGDLAESLIKRDCGAKDASRSVPGFGGVLDVVDSVLFAAPVAYWWLRGG